MKDVGNDKVLRAGEERPYGHTLVYLLPDSSATHT